MRTEPHDFPCNLRLSSIRNAQRHAALVVKRLLLILVPDRKTLVGSHHGINGNDGRFCDPPRKDAVRAVKRMFNVPHGHNATTHVKHLGKTNVFNGKGLELARFVAPCIQIPATAPIYQPQGADLTTRFGAPRAREIRDAQTTALRQSRSYDAEVRRVNFRHGRHDHLHALKEFLGLDQLAGKHRQQARTKCLHVSRQNGLRIVFNSAEKLNDG